MAEPQAILDQISRALDAWKSVSGQYPTLRDIPYQSRVEVHTLMAATLKRVVPPGSAYLNGASAALDDPGESYNAAALAGVLEAIHADYKAGYLHTVHELLHASIFADFLEMADHLLDEGYKDAAAVLAGGVLEEHLRKLCDKNGVGTDSGVTPKKADRLNADLTKASVYEKLDQKSVAAWLDLRNKAAHAKYEGYDKAQVALMTQGIRDFVTRHPA